MYICFSIFMLNPEQIPDGSFAFLVCLCDNFVYFQMLACACVGFVSLVKIQFDLNSMFFKNICVSRFFHI